MEICSSFGTESVRLATTILGDILAIQASNSIDRLPLILIFYERSPHCLPASYPASPEVFLWSRTARSRLTLAAPPHNNRSTRTRRPYGGPEPVESLARRRCAGFFNWSAGHLRTHPVRRAHARLSRECDLSRTKNSGRVIGCHRTGADPACGSPPLANGPCISRSLCQMTPLCCHRRGVASLILGERTGWVGTAGACPMATLESVLVLVCACVPVWRVVTTVDPTWDEASHLPLLSAAALLPSRRRMRVPLRCRHHRSTPTDPGGQATGALPCVNVYCPGGAFDCSYLQWSSWSTVRFGKVLTRYVRPIGHAFARVPSLRDAPPAGIYQVQYIRSGLPGGYVKYNAAFCLEAALSAILQHTEADGPWDLPARQRDRACGTSNMNSI